MAHMGYSEPFSKRSVGMGSCGTVLERPLYPPLITLTWAVARMV